MQCLQHLPRDSFLIYNAPRPEPKTVSYRDIITRIRLLQQFLMILVEYHENNDIMASMTKRA